MSNESQPPRPPTSSKIPKATNRQLRAHALKLDNAKRDLMVLRNEIVEDLEEHEAIVNALKLQLRDIDRTLHSVPGGAE